MRKKSHGKILKGKLKEQHLNTIPKLCSKNKMLTKLKIQNLINNLHIKKYKQKINFK